MDTQDIEWSFETFAWQILAVTAISFWIYCLIDVWRSRFEDQGKIVWLLAVLFLPILGCILYLFIGKDQKVKLS